jgi:hypothetical protein
MTTVLLPGRVLRRSLVDCLLSEERRVCSFVGKTGSEIDGALSVRSHRRGAALVLLRGQLALIMPLALVALWLWFEKARSGQIAPWLPPYGFLS